MAAVVPTEPRLPTTRSAEGSLESHASAKSAASAVVPTEPRLASLAIERASAALVVRQQAQHGTLPTAGAFARTGQRAGVSATVVLLVETCCVQSGISVRQAASKYSEYYEALLTELTGWIPSPFRDHHRIRVAVQHTAELADAPPMWERATPGGSRLHPTNAAWGAATQARPSSGALASTAADARPATQLPATVRASRLGAFEVYLVVPEELSAAVASIPRCATLHSKLATRRWPSVRLLSRQLRLALAPAFVRWQLDDALRRTLVALQDPRAEAAAAKASLASLTGSGAAPTLLVTLADVVAQMDGADAALRDAVAAAEAAEAAARAAAERQLLRFDGADGDAADASATSFSTAVAAGGGMRQAASAPTAASFRCRRSSRESREAAASAVGAATAGGASPLRSNRSHDRSSLVTAAAPAVSSAAFSSAAFSPAAAPAALAAAPATSRASFAAGAGGLACGAAAPATPGAAAAAASAVASAGGANDGSATAPAAASATAKELSEAAAHSLVRLADTITRNGQRASASVRDASVAALASLRADSALRAVWTVETDHITGQTRRPTKTELQAAVERHGAHASAPALVLANERLDLLAAADAALQYALHCSVGSLRTAIADEGPRASPDVAHAAAMRLAMSEALADKALRAEAEEGNEAAAARAALRKCCHPPTRLTRPHGSHTCARRTRAARAPHTRRTRAARAPHTRHHTPALGMAPSLSRRSPQCLLTSAHVACAWRVCTVWAIDMRRMRRRGRSRRFGPAQLTPCTGPVHRPRAHALWPTLRQEACTLLIWCWPVRTLCACVCVSPRYGHGACGPNPLYLPARRCVRPSAIGRWRTRRCASRSTRPRAA